MLGHVLAVAGVMLVGAAGAATAQEVSTQSAYVQGSLNLLLGERVTLTRSDDGTYALTSVGLVQITDILPPADTKPEDVRGLLTTPAGTLSFGLQSRRDVGSILRVENATGKGIRYVAYIRRVSQGAVTEPRRTSVCTVPPGLVVFEHWPEPVFQVIAASFEDVEGDAPVCESHDVNE
ncbi:MAG: hypothetical protein EON90_04420 [Brevundimonas sp.]|nr:MAG: hypothetical protein EON90_04420 [Brevundimonas sp.]